MYLSGELKITVYWYLYHLQPYTVVILVKIAKQKILNFPSTYGLAWYNMVRLDKNMPLIALPGMVYLSHRVAMTFH